MRRDRPKREDGRVDYSRRRTGHGKQSKEEEEEADAGSPDSNTDGEAAHSETSSVVWTRTTALSEVDPGITKGGGAIIKAISVSWEGQRRGDDARQNSSVK